MKLALHEIELVKYIALDVMDKFDPIRELVEQIDGVDTSIRSIAADLHPSRLPMLVANPSRGLRRRSIGAAAAACGSS
ncbi:MULTISPECIES: hypothetical protein [unclassified Caballeronia]|uniref:hypothetical protein n=1 Tax=unclassified Caballeronia TaxID=2646786 RepID=UPI0020279F8A|nr:MULTISPECIES: hypothetical protein [unclassified Caballeronia]